MKLTMAPDSSRIVEMYRSTQTCRPSLATQRRSMRYRSCGVLRISSASGFSALRSAGDVEVGEVHLSQDVGIVAEHLAEGFVEMNDAPALVGDDHAGIGILENAAETLLADAQVELGLLELVDIDHLSGAIEQPAAFVEGAQNDDQGPGFAAVLAPIAFLDLQRLATGRHRRLRRRVFLRRVVGRSQVAVVHAQQFAFAIAGELAQRAIDPQIAAVAVGDHHPDRRIDESLAEKIPGDIRLVVLGTDTGEIAQLAEQAGRVVFIRQKDRYLGGDRKQVAIAVLVQRLVAVTATFLGLRERLGPSGASAVRQNDGQRPTDQLVGTVAVHLRVSRVDLQRQPIGRGNRDAAARLLEDPLPAAYRLGQRLFAPTRGGNAPKAEGDGHAERRQSGEQRVGRRRAMTPTAETGRPADGDDQGAGERR